MQKQTYSNTKTNKWHYLKVNKKWKKSKYLSDFLVVAPVVLFPIRRILLQEARCRVVLISLVIVTVRGGRAGTRAPLLVRVVVIEGVLADGLGRFRRLFRLLRHILIVGIALRIVVLAFLVFILLLFRFHFILRVDGIFSKKEISGLANLINQSINQSIEATIELIK